MRIARARLQRIGGRLPSAISNASATWTAREGLLLQLVSRDGEQGLGEASPLPGYSRDTLEECEAALTELSAGTLEELDFTGPPNAASSQVRGWLAAHPLPPAARFAAETALFNLFARGSHRPLAALLGSPATVPRAVPLAALLPIDEPLPAARAALARGLTTLKLKIGKPGAFAQELAALHALRREVGPDIQLRLDANGAFPVAEAAGHLKALAELRPEYLEEPVPLGQLAAFAALAPPPIPLAADESLRMPELRDELVSLFGRGRIEVAVLKPTVLGGSLACLDLVAELLPHGARFTVTHAFEGPVALAAAWALASVLPGPVLAAGLDQHPALEVLRAGAA
jgi:o-succinylbenzoate synthase